MPILYEISGHNEGGNSWIGDLGSVLAEILFAYNNAGQKPIGNAELQQLINKYAPGQDMLGNIDAFAIAHQYNISGKKLKVSDLLKQYYEPENYSPDSLPGYKKRFTFFGYEMSFLRCSCCKRFG